MNLAWLFLGIDSAQCGWFKCRAWGKYKMTIIISLVPRPPPFFVLVHVQ